MNYYPLINKNKVKIKYISNGAILFIHCLVDKKITLNETAKNIYEICNGGNSISDIENYLLKKHLNADKKIIQNDVMKVLRIFDNYGIISWKNGMNPFIKYEFYKGLKIHKIYLNSLHLLKCNFQHSVYNVKFNKNKPIDINVFSQMLYLNYAKAYFIQKNEVPVALVILNNAETNYIWKFIEISYNDCFKTDDDFKKIAAFIASDLKENLYENVENELGFYIDIDLKNKNLLESMGFKRQGLLKEENEKDILSMWMTL